ncbi:MAG: phosphopentomutase [Firmicutes bacterium]|nr:phosphopentomutase [Bacillota bacterium]
MRRVFCIVLDSVGVGELPDAWKYGDEGSNTLGNISREVGGLRLPRMERLGLGNIIDIQGVRPQKQPAAAYGKMAEKSPGKDTTTGHWEMAGLILEQAFPTFPDGFPDELIGAFEKEIGRKTLGNVVASGTEIIKEMGEEHQKTGFPIVYTSADSVFQIAAHEETIPLDDLYRYCKIARELLKGPYAVGRVIARPFVGKPGSYQRTTHRHDFSLQPTGPMLLDRVKEAGLEVIGIGKINDIYVGRGLTRTTPAESNHDGMRKVIEMAADRSWSGFLMANLVDFDSLWGHRNDSRGYTSGLEEFDRDLEALEPLLTPEDILMLTADHGCDPTTSSTDHSREYVPLLIAGERVKKGTPLGVRETFADLGATVADILNVPPLTAGTSLKQLIIED